MDLWSLGCVLAELASGIHTFKRYQGYQGYQGYKNVRATHYIYITFFLSLSLSLSLSQVKPSSLRDRIKSWHLE